MWPFRKQASKKTKEIKYNDPDKTIAIRMPDFFYVEEDGTLMMEWCYGDMSSPDRWRAAYYSGPDGIYVWKTYMDGQDEWSGLEAQRKIAELLGRRDEVSKSDK